MHLTFVTDDGDGYHVEIDPGMELGNVMALLEAEVGVWLSVRCVPAIYCVVGYQCRRADTLLRRAPAC